MEKKDDFHPCIHLRIFPSSFELRPSRASTAEAYNLMESPLLGEARRDPETFLLQIKEVRAIVPIADSDFFKCLPLFLSDITLYWVRLESEN